MGAKAPIFTRSLRSLRSLSWGDHSDHSGAEVFISDLSWGEISDLRSSAFSPQILSFQSCNDEAYNHEPMYPQL